MLSRAFHAADAGGQIRTQQPGICCFVRQSPNRREPKVDGRCSIVGLLQIDAIPCYDGFVECEPRLRAIPIDEVANSVIVRALRACGREAVEDRGSGLLQVSKPQHCFWGALVFRYGHAALWAGHASRDLENRRAFSGSNPIGRAQN